MGYTDYSKLISLMYCKDITAGLFFNGTKTNFAGDCQIVIVDFRNTLYRDKWKKIALRFKFKDFKYEQEKIFRLGHNELSLYIHLEDLKKLKHFLNSIDLEAL